MSSKSDMSYNDMLAKVGSASVEDEEWQRNRNQIELDLTRTWPENPLIAAKRGQDALRRLLQAWCIWRPEVGYVQSMNFLAAFIWVNLNCHEENSFWVLAALAGNILPCFYTTGVPGLKRLAQHFAALMKRKLPAVSEASHRVNLPVCFKAYAWFLSIFFTTLDGDARVQVWDNLLYNYYYQSVPPTLGDASCRGRGNSRAAEAVLCCVGLALLRTKEERLAEAYDAVEFGDAVQQLGVDMSPEMSHELFRAAFDGSWCSVREIMAMISEEDTEGTRCLHYVAHTRAR